MSAPDPLIHARGLIREAVRAVEAGLVAELVRLAALGEADRSRICADASALVRRLRAEARPSLMEQFLAAYGLSTREGIALMCLAEAVLRVPDDRTIDALIRDKVSAGRWGQHISQSSSALVNASAWALMLTGRVIADDEQALASTLRGMVRRLGEPVVRTAVEQAMREMGRTFVLGATMEKATARATEMEAAGYTYSYDMLGEAARTEADARRYHMAYAAAISALAPRCVNVVRDNPGISVKLSALHPRYEFAQRQRVMSELLPRVLSLALLARSANMGFNIDAEEADRLDLSLDLIEAMLSSPATAGWDGFGVVVQAYGRRASAVIDWLHELARRHDRRIMVRLVKGAYWDTEIKHAQTLGLSGFPVFTRKAATDVSFLACARKLLGMTEHIYPQFATHNAHSLAAVLYMAGGMTKTAFEFQRLHGMGEALHGLVHAEHGTRCRIYAPVGAHRDLLAYLVRRLLENGANSSFVHQIMDEAIPPEEVARDPFAAIAALNEGIANPVVTAPAELFAPARRNSRGWDLSDPRVVSELDAARAAFATARWQARPMIAGDVAQTGVIREAANPARPDDCPGTIEDATPAHVASALDHAASAFPAWSARTAQDRRAVLDAAADLYETHALELFALCAREAGKTLADGVAEVREAVDFLRYYAAESVRLETEAPGSARGTFVCISPWNFPLAIFTGQIAAALAAGNTVIAKPAEQTPLIAARAAQLLHQAGVPEDVLQLLPGPGAQIGAQLVADPRIAGVCFTGSTASAQAINRNLAEYGRADAVLIAETGGINAMILDSTALPEQAVRDVIHSAFQSAGQRCSALRVLYVQDDVAERTLAMLCGAMDELRLGDPWELSTDVGPVIDTAAQAAISGYCRERAEEGRVLKTLRAPGEGFFVGPCVVRVSGIAEVQREIFGPVLHVATFRADGLGSVVDAINASGYGLTAGLHTRIDQRVQRVVDRLHAGNIYVNRNQIGAVVGSQPFGGERLSGTGPKAGGPNYLRAFRRLDTQAEAKRAYAGGQHRVEPVRPEQIQAEIDRLVALAPSPEAAARLAEDSGGLAAQALAAVRALGARERDLPGPTGESNRLSMHPRGVVLCLGPSPEQTAAQAIQALALGNGALVICDPLPDAVRALGAGEARLGRLAGTLDPAILRTLSGLAGAAYAGGGENLRDLRRALAARDGPILPLICDVIQPERYVIERHVCADTTAAGGNAALLALGS